MTDTIPVFTVVLTVCLLVYNAPPTTGWRAFVAHIATALLVGWVLALLLTGLLTADFGPGDPNAGQHM